MKINEYIDIAWRRFARHMGFDAPQHIAAYHGYSNGESIWVQGRVLGNKPVGGPLEDDGWWDNLAATYQRWQTDEISGADVRLSYGRQTVETSTDKEGYYHARFELDALYPRTSFVSVEHRADDRVLSAEHWVQLLHPDAEYVLISDIDDTVIHTGITNILLAARLTFLNNAKTRKPLTGVGELYHQLSRARGAEPSNPVLYVSNSAWNLFDLLRDFIDLNDLPRGPLLLRDLGIGAGTADHKIDTLRRLFREFAHLPVVLVGDSGQHDAEIYARVTAENPGRVLAIYIRDVDPDKDSRYDGKVDEIIADGRARDVPFLRVQNSYQIAEHAVSLGLLSPSSLGDIADAVDADRNRETLTEEVSNP